MVVIDDATTFVRVRPKDVAGKDFVRDMCVRIIGGKSRFAGKPFSCSGAKGVQDAFEKQRAMYNELPAIDGAFQIGANTALPNGCFLDQGAYWF